MEKEAKKRYMRKYMSEWRKNNPDAWHDYYVKNKDRIRGRIKKWQNEHPEKIKEYNKKQYHKKKILLKCGKN